MSRSKKTQTATVQTAFTVHASNAASIIGSFGEDGWFHIEQDGNAVSIPPQAFHRFKRAVWNLAEVQS